MVPSPPQPPQEATDIFSISDKVLADRLQFIEEIGFGNWGSVWLCRPKSESTSSCLKDHETRTSAPRTSSNAVTSVHGQPHVNDPKIAVKLVHRSKTSTTAARVRSLWNEMKVVRSLKHEPHPSIIPFYSFIITPSYALITMAFHPRLVPVEVPEQHAKEWFRSLLSGVEFLHKRGVVHNDIKPANILLSTENIPVLVDFGFAERYEMNSHAAFQSNLSYGTPEYLSPERARGLLHDTRKSDVWSLGITFFEILMGRTPFEHSEGEQFATKEDLENYWARTMKGKWVGTWKMSKGVEKMLRRMVSPNADLRWTASEAMEDDYWTCNLPIQVSTTHSHRKSASMSATLTTTLLPRPGVSTSHKEPARILEVIPPWSLSNKDARGTTTTKKTKTSKLVVAFDHEEYKENGKGTVSTSTPPPRGLRIREGGKENTHGRSTMQTSSCTSLSKPCKTTSSKIPVGEAKAKGALFSALSPIKHTRPLRVGSPTTPSTPTSGLSLSSLMRPRKISLQGGGKRRTSVSSALIFSPPTPTTTANGSGSEKENIFSVHVSGGKGKPGRKPMGPRQPSANGSPRSSLLTNSRMNGEEGRPRVRSSRKEKENKSGVSRTRKKVVNAATSGTASSASGFRSDSVRDRMREWERERERIREMERLEEKTREVDEEREREQEEAEMAAREAERRRVAEADIVPDDDDDDAEGVDSVRPTPLSPLIEGKCLTDETEEEYSRESTSLSMLKQSLKMSISTGIDGAVRLYKSSTLALGRSNVDPGETESRRTVSEQASWEDDVLVGHDVLVGDDVVAGQDKQLDRMNVWIRNIEKVVEDARQNFAASTSAGPLPPLPVAPKTSHRARIPRKILPANQIFVDQYQSGEPTSADSGMPTIPSDMPCNLILIPQTPSRTRRATVVTRSPDPLRQRNSLQLDVQLATSAPKRREKSKSQNDLGRPITPITRLEFEIERLANPQPTPTPRLSTVVDPSLFIADKLSSKDNDSVILKPSCDDLSASPLQVDPYPARPQSMADMVPLNTPAKRHIEGVYDRFLMSATGVKRNGKGYQSDNYTPIAHLAPSSTTVAKPTTRRHQKNLFGTSRKQPMPPPVSSQDWRSSALIDEFGGLSIPIAGATGTALPKSDKQGIVRRALRTIVNGKR